MEIPIPDSISAVFASTVLPALVVALSVSGSSSFTAYAVVGFSVAVSKFCESVLVATVDSLSAIFKVLPTTVVSISLTPTVVANEN